MTISLADLEPRFVRYSRRDSREVKTFATADADGNYTVPVPFSEAQGIEFLCPLCFAKNAGPIGTHGCDVTFADRGVPDDLGSHNKAGKAVRWTVNGDTFENLTITPSILIEGGCGWHGHITNGQIMP